jgi:hypothetical protein
MKREMAKRCCSRGLRTFEDLLFKIEKRACRCKEPEPSAFANNEARLHGFRNLTRERLRFDLDDVVVGHSISFRSWRFSVGVAAQAAPSNPAISRMR